MSREIYHAGYLIKSPPVKFIKRKWRRRYFTLRQGDLPGQFCLEYYEDDSMKKLKGFINLDECEQVDAGLRLDQQKLKHQHMFDIKTSNRIYYLAAETEDAMRGWVTCICQVCGLQELANNNDAPVPVPFQSSPTTASGHYKSPSIDSGSSTLTRTYNGRGLIDSNSVTNTKSYCNTANYSNITETTTIHDDSFLNGSITDNSKNEYQNQINHNNNNTFASSHMSHIFDDIHSQLNYKNVAAMSLGARSKTTSIERTQSFDNRNRAAAIKENGHAVALAESHGRSQSFNVPAVGRRIPENLKLTQSGPNDVDDAALPSPALSNSSGPYIPLSECFSGSPIIFLEDPKTPLNSLDPRFYDTPRSHINIGLNLTTNDQYSPKRNNVPSNNSPPQHHAPQLPVQRSVSPTDSDNVFPSDDDEWSNPVPPQSTLDRVPRPSDSSIDNDQNDWQFVQRFYKKETPAGCPPGRPDKKKLLLENERIRETPSSDTENPSPIIGPLDTSCSVDDASTYDLPRSHQMHYSYNDGDTMSISSHDMTATSTPNYQHGNSGRSYKHNYTNAAPMKVGGNIFSYDFDQNPPSVNRELKPKPGKMSSAKIPPIMGPPPNVNRSKKPNPPSRSGRLTTGTLTGSMKPAQPALMDLIVDDVQSLNLSTDVGSMPVTNKSAEATHLQYLDLDHSNPNKASPKPIQKLSLSGSKSSSISVQNLNTSLPSAVGSSPSLKVKPNYVKVDFVKTRAFNEIRMESEQQRMLQDGQH